MNEFFEVSVEPHAGARTIVANYRACLLAITGPYEHKLLRNIGVEEKGTDSVALSPSGQKTKLPTFYPSHAKHT